MSARNAYGHGLTFASVLALLVAVTTSPIRPSRSADHPSHSDHLRRNFAVPSSGPTRLIAASPTSAPAQVKALNSEGEEDLDGMILSIGYPSAPPRVSSFKPARASATLGPIRAIYPLRC